jgi:purine-nucleoside/S-methyl-5'-thioadenosine phosphorylase / adenosine deaminase
MASLPRRRLARTRSRARISSPMNDPTQPRNLGGYPVWTPTEGVSFVGRGEDLPRHRVLEATTGVRRPVAWARQVHGALCAEARTGCGGRADALTTTRRDLVLAISTADCVPVALATSTRVTMVHAGWRGIVAGIVPRAVESFSEDPERPRAWIGPAIGACCYEVGSEVAKEVLSACGDPEALCRADGRSLPSLDLRRAVESQLRISSVRDVSSIGTCTRCDRRLHSYRRDGREAGRNLAFAWLPTTV